MKEEYLLFLDTETTGLPTRWTRPYAEEQEWPCVAQLAWVVYTSDGQLVKTDQDYLQIPEGRMPATAIAIHGLTPAFLKEHGQEPTTVLQRLLNDLATYRPRVVGHFLQLDFHVLGAAFARANLPNPLPELPQFCTMRLMWPVVPGAHHHRRLRLYELHERLFGVPMERLHDAYIDAAATARCFFELRRRGRITTSVLNGQHILRLPTGHTPQPSASRWLRLLAVASIVLLILLWLVYG